LLARTYVGRRRVDTVDQRPLLLQLLLLAANERLMLAQKQVLELHHVGHRPLVRLH
jgi:hypothetical protein